MTEQDIENVFLPELMKEKEDIVRIFKENDINHFNTTAKLHVTKNKLKRDRNFLDVELSWNSGDIRRVIITLWGMVESKISSLELTIEDRVTGPGLCCQAYDEDTLSNRYSMGRHTMQPHVWQSVKANQNVEYSMTFQNDEYGYHNVKIPESIMEIMNHVDGLFVRTSEEVEDYYYERNMKNRVREFNSEKDHRYIKTEEELKAFRPKMVLKDDFLHLELSHTYGFTKDYIRELKDYDRYKKVPKDKVVDSLENADVPVSDELLNLGSEQEIYIRYVDIDKNLVFSDIDSNVLMEIKSEKDTVLEDIKTMKKVLRELTFSVFS